MHSPRADTQRPEKNLPTESASATPKNMRPGSNRLLRFVLCAFFAASLCQEATAKPGATGRAHKSASKKSKPTPPPAIELEHVSTHQTLLLRPVANGGFGRKQMQAVSSFLRCHHTGRRHAMSERLVNILYQVARHYHNAKLHIVAGYRAPKIARQKGNPKSPHKQGVACDFQVDGVPIETVRDFLRNTYAHIGVGYYPNSGFVHLDVGRKKNAFWVDYSGPGEKARYAPLLRKEQKRMARADQARETSKAAPMPEKTEPASKKAETAEAPNEEALADS